MAATHWTGPLYSTNGFVGDITGNINAASLKAADGTTAMTLASSTGVVTFAAVPATGGSKAADGTAGITLANSTGIATILGGLTMTDAKNVIVGSTTGTKIGTATSQKLGFWNATPVIQPATTGTTTGFTAGSGTTAKSDSTYTGNTGTAAYTVGDVVLALKQAGIMAA